MRTKFRQAAKTFVTTAQQQQALNLQFIQCLIDVANALPADKRGMLAESLKNLLHSAKLDQDRSAALFEQLISELGSENDA